MLHFLATSHSGLFASVCVLLDSVLILIVVIKMLASTQFLEPLQISEARSQLAKKVQDFSLQIDDEVEVDILCEAALHIAAGVP